MAKLSLLVLLLIAPHWVASVASEIDLLSNSTKTGYGLRKDKTFYYLDSYINDCLSQIGQCDHGFTLVFNVSVLSNNKMTLGDDYDSSYFNGRKVLASSGGDSRFTTGGFYLHHVNIRGDSYLELGIRSFDQLFCKHIYLDEVSKNYKLAFVWNKEMMTIYIDGVLYETVSEPVTWPFFSLNFNPNKNFKTSVFKQGVSNVNSIIFKDTVVDNTNSLVSVSFNSQQHWKTIGETFDIDIQLQYEDRIEVKQPIGFSISFLRTESTNFKTIINFGPATEQLTIIGKGLVFNEFVQPGKRIINMTSVSLSNPKLVSSKQIEIDVLPKLKTEPMNSLKLALTRNEDSTTIIANVIVSGGAPYTCVINFGDSNKNEEFQSNMRLTTKNITHIYALYGIYKVSLSCKSNLVTSVVSDEQFIYISEKSSNAVKQSYLEKKENPNELIEFELPFDDCTNGLKLEVIDHFSDLVISEWTCPEEKKTDGKHKLSLKSAELKNPLENFLTLRFKNTINVASYLVIWQEKIKISPKIKVITPKPRIDQPTEFEITISPYSDSIVRIDFGDEIDYPLMYLINDDKPSTDKHVFHFSHTYSKRPNSDEQTQRFTLSVKQANYISESSAHVDLEYELALSDFLLELSVTELDDINLDPIVFKLQPLKKIVPMKVSEIKLVFDISEPSKFITIKDYTFDSSNDFMVKMEHVYDKYGISTAEITIANSISEQVISRSVRIGKDLEHIEGYIVNPYAPVNTDITFFVKINGGNGYNLDLDLDNGKHLSLTWNQLRDQTSVPGVEYHVSGGFFLKTKYQNTGKYFPVATLKNVFGSLKLSFCSQLMILPKNMNRLSTLQANESCSFENDIVLRKNSKIIRTVEEGVFVEEFKMGKGIKNTFDFEYVECNETQSSSKSTDLKMYWYMNRIITAYVAGQSKQIEYERSMPNSCVSDEETNAIEFQPNQLMPGDYLLKIYVFDKNYPEEFFVFTQKIILGASPLIIKINNPMYIELNWNEQLNLDFIRDSYDPDEIETNLASPFKFELVCAKGDSQEEILDDLETKAKLGDFDYVSQGFSQVYQSSQLDIFDRNCFELNQSSENAFRVSSDGQISLDAQLILLNQTELRPILLEVLIHRDNRLSISDRIQLSLNISSAFLIEPSVDLDEMADQLNKVDDLVKKNPKKALGLLGTFANAINDRSAAVPADQNVTTTTKVAKSSENGKLSGLRGKMLGTVDKIVGLVDDADSFLIACDTTGSVTSNPDQMPTENQDQGAAVMESMGNNMKTLKSNSGAINNIAGSMLSTTGNVFLAASKTVPVVSKNNSEIDLLSDENDTIVEPPPLPAKITAPLELYELDTEAFPDEIYEIQLEEQRVKREEEDSLRKKTANIAGRTFNGISNAGGAMASNSDNSGNTTKIESGGMSLVVAKQTFNASDNSTSDKFSSDSGPSIVMPSLNKLVNATDGPPPNIATKMFVSKENPFQSSNPDKQTTGAIVSMELSDEDGNPIPVNNTSEPFVIKVPAQEEARSYDASVNLTSISYYKTVLLTNSSSLHVVVMPENIGDSYHVYVKYSAKPRTDALKYPDEENYDYSFTLPNNRSFPDEMSELKYTAFVGNNETKGNGTYYIGVKLFKLSEEAKLRKKMINDTELSNQMPVNFTMRLFSTSCKYWDANTSEWHTDGCFVSPDTTYDTTVCLCYHLTTFGSDFYVPPNTIDFGSVFGKFKNLSENCAVFATVMSIFGLYILVAIYARYKDKKDLLKWGVTPLPDNLPTDSFYYVIQVQTGFGKECGTTSKIGFVLAGEEADSGVRKLTDEKRRAFKSGSICNFLMSTEEPLGPLLYLRIWHDNSGQGSNKSWHLNMVNVVDLQSNEKSSFVCNDWLAVEKSDGLTDRVLTLACNKDVTQFKHLFTQSVKKKFTDNHLWVSVFSRPTRSNFTRLQRISCCMSVLFCTMIANAMFYKAESASVAPLVKLGPFKFTMAQVFTSVISTLIVVPVNIIVVTLFRKSKLKSQKILPSRSQHVAKQEFWRQSNISSIELSNSSNSIFSSNPDIQKKTSSTKKTLNGIKKMFNKRSISEYKRETADDKLNKKSGRNLPHFFIYVSWFLCVISMTVPAFFVILYSMQWGKERSNAWLGTMALSFFQSLLVIDPLKVFIITAIITFILRKPDEEENNIMDVNDPIYTAILNKDEEYLHKSMTSLSEIDIREIKESRKKILTKLEPISAIDLELQRTARLNKLKMNEILREGFSYLAFLVVVLFLAQQVKSPDSNRVHTDLTRIYLTNSPINFESIQSRSDFWLYVEKVLIENLYAPDWYNNKTLMWREKLTIKNRNAIRVGAARLRQLRVKDDTCKVHSSVEKMFSHCRGPYSFINDDTKDYDIGWIQINESAPLTTTTTVRPGKKPSKYKCQSAWCYQNSIQTKSVPIMGKFTTYKGGGYVVTLGRTRDRSLALIDELKDNDWIDDLTRAVFFEFTVFNPNVNLFASFNLIVEFLNIGAGITYHSISIFSLYSYLGSFGIVVLVFQIIFVIFIIYFLVHEIMQIKKQKCAYFKQFWNMNEFLIIVFSIISMVMFGLRTVFTTLAIKDVHETEMAGFVNFNTLAQWNELYQSLVSFIVFCASLKFLKLLRFNKRIGMLAATLRYAGKDLLSFSFTMFVFFFSFTMFGYVVFGSHVVGYKDFMTSLESHFRFALGQYDFRGLIDAEFVIGSIYFISFIFIVIMGLMSMFVAILSEAFEKVKEDLQKQKNEHEMLSYISGAIKSLASRKKNKSKPGSGSKVDDLTSSLNKTAMSVTVKEPVEYTHLNLTK